MIHQTHTESSGVRVNNSRLLLLVATVFALVNGNSCDRWKSEPSGDSPSTQSYGTSSSIVHALGRIEPESRIVDVAAPLGSIISKLEVAEGDEVSAGDVIAVLDTHQEMVAALETAKVRLHDGQQRRLVESRISQAVIDHAKLQQQHAEEVLHLKIRAQESLVRLHEAEAEQASRDAERAELLQSGDVISSSDLEDVVLSRRSADEALQHSQHVLAQLRSDRELQLEMSRAKVVEAVAQKERQQIVAEVDALATAVAVAEARVEKCLVRAPLGGRVIQVQTRPGERVGNDPIVRLGNTQVMFVVAEVYETDVRRVEIGQRAKIISRAFTEELVGSVVQKGTLVERNDVLSADPTADVDARIVEVRIKLDDSRVAANYNQHQVDVSIQVDESEMQQRAQR